MTENHELIRRKAPHKYRFNYCYYSAQGPHLCAGLLEWLQKPASLRKETLEAGQYPSAVTICTVELLSKTFTLEATFRLPGGDSGCVLVESDALSIAWSLSAFVPNPEHWTDILIAQAFITETHPQIIALRSY